MLIDWLIYGLLLWGLVFALNAVVFKKQPASRTTAWALTFGMFFVNLIALTVLQFLRYKMISQDLGISIKPRSPADFGGAFAASWFFFILLRKAPRQPKERGGATLSSMAVSVSEQNTFPQLAMQPSGIVMNTSTSAASLDSHQQPTVDEDQIYSLIAEELETGTVDKGLWTRLFAECSGDEKHAKVLYIKQRAERLISAERLRLEQVERERTAEIERLEKLRLQNLSLKEKLMPQNITSELAERVRDLSKTDSAITILNKVRMNQVGDVLAMLNDNPLLIAVTNSDGDTPLHIALREKYPKMVQLLIENGARVEVENVFGITPIELANRSGKEDVVHMVTLCIPSNLIA